MHNNQSKEAFGLNICRNKKLIFKCLSSLQELAKLLEDQHGYIDLYNIPENKYYSMTQSSNEEEKL